MGTPNVPNVEDGKIMCVLYLTPNAPAERPAGELTHEKQHDCQTPRQDDKKEIEPPLVINWFSRIVILLASVCSGVLLVGRGFDLDHPNYWLIFSGFCSVELGFLNLWLGFFDSWIW